MVTSRERVLMSLQHQKPDRAPRLLYDELIGYVPKIERLLKERCFPRTPREVFDMDIAAVALRPTTHARDRFAGWMPAEASVDEWGVWWRAGTFEHYAHVESPLAGVDDLARIQEYPWPDLDQPYRYDGLADTVTALQAQGLAVAGYAGSIFEQAWYLRSWENLMLDMVARPEIAHFLLDRTAYFQKAAAVALAKAGVDILMLGDDVATQRGLMISKPTWREFLGPRLTETIAATKAARPETRIFYHSDGNVEPLIPELIRAGVEILNPLQPDCLDPVEVKRKYGKEITLFGTVSVQHTMPFGTPDEVRAEVLTRMRTLGYDGGLILSPAHVLGPDVPWENIVAFFAAANEAQ